MSTEAVYPASPIKRRRATQAEMEERAQFLIDYAERHGPVTVRGLYYQAEVAGILGIDKTEGGYNKVQNQVLQLPRAMRLPYDCVADATRYMRKPRSFDGWEEALQNTALVYRKDLWAQTDVEVEIWLEKSALAGVVYPVTAEFDVPLMCTMGFSSETFTYEAVSRLRDTGRTLVIYALYDFDQSGQDASRSLREKVERFGATYDVPVQFQELALTHDQVMDLGLPTRAPKRTSARGQKWPHPVAAELDAIPPDTLRALVRSAIEQHLPANELKRLKRIEAMERETLQAFIGGDL